MSVRREWCWGRMFLWKIRVVMMVDVGGSLRACHCEMGSRRRRSNTLFESRERNRKIHVDAELSRGFEHCTNRTYIGGAVILDYAGGKH